MASLSPPPFSFPTHYSFPPFFTPQPTLQTRQAQLRRWSMLIQAYCRHQRVYSLNLASALDTPLFHNTAIRKRVSLQHAKDIIDFMSSPDGDARAEWRGPDKTAAWIWWRTPDEWAELISTWVDETGQKNVVLTLYELVEGEATVSQDFHGLEKPILQRSLATLVKKGRAQVFGSDGQEGVKFF
ncbi:hypothetical protein DV738_g1491, partial [Chaetothyriales sp. CBS 135597]